MIARILALAFAFSLLIQPAPASAQGAPNAPQGQAPGRDPRDVQRANQQRTSSLPPEILALPYNGPGATQLPPNIRTRADIENPANRGALEAAAAAARPRLEAGRRLTERVASGDRTLPTPEETRTITNPPAGPPPNPAPRPRAERPIYNLLSLVERLADSRFLPAPDAEPAASPDEQAYGTCGTYSWLWDSYDYQWGAKFFYAEGLQHCGVVNAADIRSMSMSTHLFRCGWYFSWFNYCLGPQFYDELLPADYQGPGINYQWGRIKTYYPWQSGAYFLRVYTYAEYWNTGWTSNSADSPGFNTYNCPGSGCS